ncbi:MAG TPA: tyrosine-type recombinase/integrase, partial [Ktedonosporobacter sp.]|nr:tyrosine-type recombinase/integrase [Ktedonosporobacter sp.]
MLTFYAFPKVMMMRHVAASYLLSQGVSVNVVQNILGHSSPIITMTVYGHSSQQFKRDAVQHFDRLYG